MTVKSSQLRFRPGTPKRRRSRFCSLSAGFVLTASLCAGSAWAQQQQGGHSTGDNEAGQQQTATEASTPLQAPPNPEAEDAFFEGYALLQGGDPEAALDAFERALDLQPSLYRAHLYRGRAFVALNDVDRALEAMQAFGMGLSSQAEQKELETLGATIGELRLHQKEPPKDRDAPPSDAPPQVIPVEGAGKGTEPDKGSSSTDEAPNTTGESAPGTNSDSGSSKGDGGTDTSPATEDTPQDPVEEPDAEAVGERRPLPPARDDEPSKTISSLHIRSIAPRVLLGVDGGYSMTIGKERYSWGMAQLRLEVRLLAGLHLSVQAALGMAQENEALYGVLPGAVGVAYRFEGRRVVPFLDGHFLFVWYEDGTNAAGQEVTTTESETPGVGLGGGGGGGLDILLTPLGRRNRVALTPAVHAGWAGVFVLRASLGVTLGF